MLFWKSRGLMTGSAARISRRKKATHIDDREDEQADDLPASAQAYVLPPQLRPSSSGTAAATRSAEPT